MNILLIRPRPDNKTIGLQHVMVCEPLELEYIASNIDFKDNNIEIIDMILEEKSLEYFIDIYHPDIVGMTGYISSVNVIKDYSQRIKNINPRCKVVVGGVHAEVVPEDFDDANIDFIINANGISTFNEILRNPNEGNIEGIYKKGVKSTKKESIPYNLPDRSLVEKYRKSYYYMFHNPCALIKTSFGCPYNCSFCFCKEITGGKYFERDIESVISELKEIPEKEIYIVDDDFLFKKERILKFCRELEKNSIDKNFLVYGRSDFICDNEDVIKYFKECGLRAVIVGLESFKDEELNNYNKRTSIKENEMAIKILKKYNIEVYGTIILHMDYDKEDFNNLYKWLKQLEITFINLQPLTPLPGTQIYDLYKDKLIISRKEHEKWDLAHLVLEPSRISVRRYYFEIVKLYYKITISPANVIKLIKKYGFKQVFKLSMGSSIVTIQYIKKILRGY